MILTDGYDKNSLNIASCYRYATQVRIQSFLSCYAKTVLNNQAFVADLPKQNNKKSISCSPDSVLTASKSRPYFMGIDPGVKGAICIYDGVKIVDCFDMPTVDITVKGKERKRLDILNLAFKIDAVAPLINFALIEDVGQVGTNADPFSSFVFGFATGAVHGVLTTCLIPVEKIKPSVWKAALGLSSDKDLSIEKAKRLIPDSSKYLTLKKHDGRAEAILLAFVASKTRKS